jgi:hypothetical protein
VAIERRFVYFCVFLCGGGTREPTMVETVCGRSGFKSGFRFTTGVGHRGHALNTAIIN